MPSIPRDCERCDTRPPTTTRRDEILERDVHVCARCAAWYDEHAAYLAARDPHRRPAA